MSIEEAARRRDFTINAISWDPLTDEYLDPRGGRADLEARVLRVVDRATFADDSLRVLRAMQFVARFELTALAARRSRSAAPSRSTICRPSASGPSSRSCSCSRSARRSASRSRATPASSRACCPKWRRSSAAAQEPEWHPEGDVWMHTLMVIDEARRRIDDLPRSAKVAVMLGAVCHDFGKPATTAFIDGRIRSHDHEEAGVAPAARCSTG